MVPRRRAEQRWAVLVSTIVIHSLGLLAGVAVYVMDTGVSGDLSWAHLPFVLYVTVGSMVIPATWAVCAGAVLDHWVAPRGPLWALIIHPCGLAVTGLYFMVKFTGIPGVHYWYIGAFFAGLPALLGVVGVFLTALIPGSFPRKSRAAA